MWSISKYPWHFTELEQITQKFIWNNERPRTAKAILRGKEQSRRHNSLRLKTILKSYSNLNSVGGTKTDMWNKIESQEIKPQPYSQLILKGGNNIKWGKNNLFSKWYREHWTVACKSVKMEHTLTPCTKIKSNGLKT